jgi:uncharacterized membrane protein
MTELPSSSRELTAATAGLKPRSPASSGLRSFLSSVRARLISGVVFMLPIVITFWIVYWIFLTIQRFLLTPLAAFVNRIGALMRDNPALEELPRWWFNVVSPLLAIFLALGMLYILGLIFRSWVSRTLDWFLLRVPIVATIYRAVRQLVETLGTQFLAGAEFKRVVLVEFPHPGIKSLALVTNSLSDATTGRTILSVYVVTGLMPPAGFTLFVPEESVTNVAWSIHETLQSILSGGITAPTTIHYFEGLSTHLNSASGPIVAAKGHVLGSVTPPDEAGKS